MLHPELSLKLMRRAGHRLDDARHRNANNSELERLIKQRDLAVKLFIKHTSKMTARELQELRRKLIP